MKWEGGYEYYSSSKHILLMLDRARPNEAKHYPLNALKIGKISTSEARCEISALLQQALVALLAQSKSHAFLSRLHLWCLALRSESRQRLSTGFQHPGGIRVHHYANQDSSIVHPLTTLPTEA